MAPIAPTVKALAEKHGIDLASVAGTGKNGAIKKADVEALISAGASSSSSKGKPADDVNAKRAENYAAGQPAPEPAPEAPVAAEAAKYRCPDCGRGYLEDGECSGGEFRHAPVELEKVKA